MDIHQLDNQILLIHLKLLIYHLALISNSAVLMRGRDKKSVGAAVAMGLRGRERGERAQIKKESGVAARLARNPFANSFKLS